MHRFVLATLFALGLLGLAVQSAPAADDLKPEVTYGRIKEFTTGQKVVIDVDNAIDKTFELNDKDVAVTVAKNLKTGDPVKIVEAKTALGKTRTVTITKHTGGGVTHGDKPDGRKP